MLLLSNGHIATALSLFVLIQSALADESIESLQHWTAAAPMLQPRSESGVVLLENGKVLVFGSHSIGDGPVASAELYDPMTDHWTAAGALNTPRNGIFQSAVLLARWPSPVGW